MYGERGAALVLAVMAITVLMALGAALVLITSTETAIAGNFHRSREAFYAAEAIAELAVAELRSSANTNWTSFVEGTARSRFVDGAPAGVRTVPPDAPVDLAAIRNLANCSTPAPCVGVPRWQLFAYGPLRELLPTAGDSPFYVVALVALAEGVSADPAVAIRGEAFGLNGAYGAIELTAIRTASGLTQIGRARFVP
jgi:Tfp pilus assembly protein PilX